MASYQEMDVKLKVLEDKIDFVMRTFSVANPLTPFSKPKSLLEIYHEVKTGGYSLQQAVDDFHRREGEVVDAEVVETPTQISEESNDVCVDEDSGGTKNE